MYKQIIIARKDLGMSPGKLAAQVSHASIAFLINGLKHGARAVDNKYFSGSFFTNKSLNRLAQEAIDRGENHFYASPVNPNDTFGEYKFSKPDMYIESTLAISAQFYKEWICDGQTKVILEAKNKNDIDKAIKLSQELGLQIDRDFFIIRDLCRTELTPEENSSTITCIGFMPMEESIIDKIGRKFQLWKE